MLNGALNIQGVFCFGNN